MDSEELDLPPNFMSQTNYSRTGRILGFILSLLVLFGVSFYSLIVFWPLPELASPLTIKVEKGASLKEIGEDLKEKKVINDSQTFVLAARIMGHETSIRAGLFSLSDLRSNYHIVQQLVNGTPVLKKITIPEGMRKEQIATAFQDALGLDRRVFISLCEDKKFIQSLGLQVSSLEGFLFPNTYHFHENETSIRIIQTMVLEYQKLFNNELKLRLSDFGLTELEIVTLASIIEGEAIYDSERPLISSVYHNRLKKGMRLQADPTIQFIIDDGPRRLLKKDLKIQSPYNTYKIYGLPPGPINSPGKESLLAALLPVDADFLFFVANGEGYHTFSKTQKEHNIAKKKFQRYRKSLKRQQAKK